MYHKRQGKIQNFIAKFSNQKELANFSQLQSPELAFLAKMYANEGVYAKSINLFLLALDKESSQELRVEIFLNLASAYMKAGFLSKAQEVLEECLTLQTRNTKALIFLKYIFIKLRLFKQAKIILDALEELGLKLEIERTFIELLEGKKDLTSFIGENLNEYIARFLYEQRMLDVYPPLSLGIDLLSTLKIPVNEEDNEYAQFFYATGISKKNKIFFTNSKLKMLKLLNDNDLKAKLAFFYHCKECKSELLVFSYHCPNCYKFASVKISVEVELNEEN